MSETSKRKRKTLKIIRMVAVDLAILLLLVGAFLYFYLFRQEELTPTELPHLTAAPTATPTPAAAENPPADSTQTDAPETPTPVPEPSLLNGKFSDYFTDGEIVSSEDGYASAKVAVRMNTVQTGEITYHVADIYIKDITSLRGMIYSDYGSKTYMDVVDMAQQSNSIVAISGDFFGFRKAGLVIRNGVEWRKKSSQEDVCVLYYDGTMETYNWRQTYDNLDAIYAKGPYQAWCFGPMLLDENGQPMTEFSSTLTRVNPRSAIGYFEPGHYCFVLVDGRQAGYSVGMTMEELSQLFYDLGCKAAYNFDGGATAVMAYMGNLYSRPTGKDRKISDIVMIGEPQAQADAE